MLLFIFIREEYLTEEANFNTSHVTVYQKDWTAKVADSTISIHLMLLFIEEDHNKITGAKRISIHLMLLFIVLPSVLPLLFALFQYISCYCLSSLIYLHLKHLSISIHLMLLFIINFTLTSPNPVYFNTSHVTVYPPLQTLSFIFPIFQYISCYCLSFFVDMDSSNMLNFNTSHVTVYRYANDVRRVCAEFQYISCYCLSNIHLRIRIYIRISIHLMLLFIFLFFYYFWFFYTISIHLMLLFI